MVDRRISVIAELVAIIKQKKNPEHIHFISRRILRLQKIVNLIFPKTEINNIYYQRLLLDAEFDKKLNSSKCSQIIELASGYSLRGFNKTQKNPRTKYIEIDLKNIISKKKEIINQILTQKKIKPNKNHILISDDLLKPQYINKILKNIDKNKKTLILAEGLSLYLDKKSFELYFNNIIKLLRKIPNSQFFSHERIKFKKSHRCKIIRRFISHITKTKAHIRFKTSEDLEKFLKNKKIKNINIYKLETQNYYTISLEKNKSEKP